MLGRRPAGNALVELVNLLASDPLVEVTDRQTVEEIETRYGIDLGARFPEELEALFRDYLLHCLRDRRFFVTESEAARRLAAALGVTPARRTVIERQVARKVYLDLVEEVLEDGVVDPEERELLDALQAHLELPRDVAENMLVLRRKRFGRR